MAFPVISWIYGVWGAVSLPTAAAVVAAGFGFGVWPATSFGLNATAAASAASTLIDPRYR